MVSDRLLRETQSFNHDATKIFHVENVACLKFNCRNVVCLKFNCDVIKISKYD